MKLTIDEKACLKCHLTVPEALIILAIRMGDNHEKMMENLFNREILVQRGDETLVTQHWSDILDEILCDSSGTIDVEERLIKLAQKMRECFPEGKMPGTAYYYRCNNREVVQKLKKFFVQYGNYPDSKIIEATQRFVASYRGNYRYLPLIKYFISKNKMIIDEDGTNHVTEVSQLASYLENKEEGGRAFTNSDEWMLNSRN